MSKKEKRLQSFFICIITYIFAFGFSFLVGFFIRDKHPLFVVLIADITGTIVVFIFSFVFKNSSLYDPYWSVAPVPIALYWFSLYYMRSGIISVRQILVLSLILIWAVRLTLNWVKQWRGLSQEDWRYIRIQHKTGKAYWLVSFLGIHMFPTILVYLGCLSVYVALLSNGRAFNVFDVFGIIVTSVAIVIEAVSDKQLQSFTKKHKQRHGHKHVMREGLWKYTRHPNYFGEIMFWIGLFLFSLASHPKYWWSVFGPISMVLLFTLISIPMMEKHIIKKRPSYKEYMNRTSPLIPWFVKKR